MILEMLLLSRALQEPDLLKVPPNQTIVSTTGRATLASGAQVELIGACELSAESLGPWGYDGTALGSGQTTWFWHALGERPDYKEARSMWQGDKTKRTFAIALRSKPDLFVHLPLESVISQNAGAEYSCPPDPGRGFTWAASSFIFRRPEGDRMDFAVEVEPLKSTRVFEFVPAKRDWPSGFGFDVTFRRSKAIMSISGKRTILKMIDYHVVATVPKPWEDVELVLRTSDQPAKGDFPGIPNFGYGERKGGKIAFDLSVQVRPGFHRTFILEASTKTFVTFKDIPLKPAGAVTNH